MNGWNCSQLVAASFAVSRCALYPGSFTHVTPAFVYPHTCFVDTERRAERFFAEPAVRDYVNERKVYSEEPRIRFHRADYVQELPEAKESYDLLISQYAGFVSQHCKQYLKVGGMLLVNNSHGDASMARLDQDFALVGAINRRGERLTMVEKRLDSYFVPKRDRTITREYLERTKRGVAYTRSAFGYVFRRVR